MTEAANAYTTEVTLHDHRIEMEKQLYAGPTNFMVRNKGSMEHNLEVEGQGIEERFDRNLKPGETRTMQVDLEPGTYEAYCPVDNHEDRGMRTEFNVTGVRRAAEQAHVHRETL
jgi:uncharacterized cupredoxin-like copper-binding protein